MQAMPTPASPQDAGIQWSHRVIPLSYGKHRCGRIAWTPEPQSIAVESKLEADVLAVLVQQGHLLAVHSQPFTLSFMDGDTKRSYTPDFLLVYNRLSRLLTRWGFALWTVVEVKATGLRAGHELEIRRRLDAVQQQLGMAAVCLTDADLPMGRA